MAYTKSAVGSTVPVVATSTLVFRLSLCLINPTQLTSCARVPLSKTKAYIHRWTMENSGSCISCLKLNKLFVRLLLAHSAG